MDVLARGEDRFGQFRTARVPTDSSPAAVERLRAEIVERMYGNLMPPTPPAGEDGASDAARRGSPR